MKRLSLLFAIYILLLPCIACADNIECSNASKAIISQSGTNHQSHQHEEEACNPFCNCVCCGQVIVLNISFNKFAIEHFVKAKKQHFFYSSISLPSDFYGNIWQPPKVS